jgi:hypothetical protein
MAIEGKTFVGRKVALDSRQFVSCTFRDCELIYRGGKPPSFQNCLITGNTFIFDGQAGNTLAFLQSLAAPGSGLQNVVAEMFPGIAFVAPEHRW